MIKIVALWLFVLATLADLVVITLKCFDIIDWSWALIIAIPFVITIVGTIAFSILYLLIKLFVILAIRS